MPPTDDSACVIVALGRFITPTDTDILIRALASLFDLNWSLRIVADADWHADQSRATAEVLGVEARVTFGSMPEWNDADLFACAVEPPDLDAAAAEAFRHGLPVIASALTAGAYITPENGVVCPPGDVEQLSKAVRRLIFDDTLRESFASAVRATSL